VKENRQTERESISSGIKEPSKQVMGSIIEVTSYLTIMGFNFLETRVKTSLLVSMLDALYIHYDNEGLTKRPRES